MSYNIEKMKEDGISEKIIQIISMGESDLYALTLRNIENGYLFNQLFLEESYDSPRVILYAAAAGLITREEAKWLLDENNPYKIVVEEPEEPEEPEGS